MFFATSKRRKRHSPPRTIPYRPRLEALEERILLDTYLVRSNLDVGPDTLRAAIIQANNNPGLDQIHFDLTGFGVETISLTSALPPITDAVIIDGTTQPTFVGLPIIEIDGSGASPASGFEVVASGTTIRGLIINRFSSGAGIVLNSDNNLIENNWIGTNDTGKGAAPNANGIQVNSSNNVIQFNVISGNANDGIASSSFTSNNLIRGNLIGTDTSGSSALSNGQNGITMIDANDWVIGGPSVSDRNVISGNLKHGIYIETFTAGASNNIIQSNFIGTNQTGTAALPNQEDGIHIAGATDTTIGGTSASQRNLISGNRQSGIFLGQSPNGAPATGNQIQGNYIGTDVNGNSAIGNNVGIAIAFPATSNTIGGTASGAGNVISGNTFDGISIFDAGGNSLVGGRSELAGGFGLSLGFTTNSVQGNLIGTDATGTKALGNGHNGITISNYGDNQIGGAARNILSGNGDAGIEIVGSFASGNRVQGNYIGTDVTGMAAIPNVDEGVEINDAPFNVVGGPNSQDTNVISGNGLGIVIEGVSASNNNIQGNLIGTNATGSGPLGNAGNGVTIEEAFDNAINENTIAFNGGHGVHVTAITGGATGNSILSNRIFNNAGLGIELGDDGFTANDPLDTDFGPNGLQNFPTLASVALGSVNISGELDSNANDSFTLQFFANPNGGSQGEILLGSTFVTTDASGRAAFFVSFATSIFPGTTITATATGREGTSEFSTPFLFIPPPVTTTPQSTNLLNTFFVQRLDELTQNVSPIILPDNDLDGLPVRKPVVSGVSAVFEPVPLANETAGVEASATGQISGIVYLDPTGDSDGIPPEDQTVVPGMVVFLDQNGNGLLDEGELFAITDHKGVFVFNNLPIDEYNVVLARPRGLRQTFPVRSGHKVSITSNERIVSDVNFGCFFIRRGTSASPPLESGEIAKEESNRDLDIALYVEQILAENEETLSDGPETTESELPSQTRSSEEEPRLVPTEAGPYAILSLAIALAGWQFRSRHDDEN
ncbi:MAG: hypothetical protein KatS3mg105_3418 [Gemmatales bacterium]|nr:MAG: hypothetical protein KatS3mg105_3418 [Gemmatales bacterium]